MAASFRGHLGFLSNFHPARVELDGVVYPTVENAYQAAKTTPDKRSPFVSCTPGQAKRLGRKVPMIPDWEAVKLSVMQRLIEQKFSSANPTLADLLIRTGDMELVEANDWGDDYWGVYRGQGENHLGRLLMERRSALNLENSS